MKLRSDSSLYPNHKKSSQRYCQHWEGFQAESFLYFLPQVTAPLKLAVGGVNLFQDKTQLRKQKGWSQTDLAKKIEASREAIGKYERNEAFPSVETAKKIADAFEVTLDYLVDETAIPTLDKKTVNRLKDIQALTDEDKNHVFALLDAFLTKTKLQSLL